MALQYTKVMISYLEEHHPNHRHPVLPSTPRRAFAALLIEILSDQWLVIQAMYWRWGEGVADKQRLYLLSEFGDTMGAGKKATVEEKLATEKTVYPPFPPNVPTLTPTSQK